jgi:DNA-binding CsgD family transcriptional regulator
MKLIKLKAVGFLRLIFSLSLLSISILNGITNIFNKESFLIIFVMSVPFFFLSGVMFFIENKRAISLVCLIAALYSALNQNDIGDYSAAIFFIYSFHTNKNKYYGIIIIFTSILCISINAIIIDSRISVIVGLFIAYTVIYIIYYFYIHKAAENKYNLNYATLSEEEKAIIKLYKRGYSYSKISKTLQMNVTDTTIRRKIRQVKLKSGCKNDVQFGQWLFGNV